LGDFLVYAVACLVIIAAAAGASVFILHLNKEKVDRTEENR
jgi:hypothetical protein